MKKIFLLINLFCGFAFAQNGLQFAYPTQVSGVAPIVVTNNTVISIPQANTTTDGFLSSADWNTFNTGSANNWKISGNALGNNTSFFGSTDNRSIIFKTNNAPIFKVDSLGIFRMYTTASTSTTSGAFWFDGGLSGNSGFNFISDDPTNASFGFNFQNTSNYFKLYQDHGANNWLVVKSGSNFVVSVDGGGSQAFEIDRTQMTWAVGTSTVGNGTTYLWSAANNTGQTASTEEVYFKYASKSIQYATGALARHRNFFVSQPTIKFVGASTVTDAANLYVESAPIASTNATITNSSALLISGMSGTASVGAGVTNAYGIKVHPPTGATNNYAAAFLGKTGINNSAPSATLDITGTMSVSGTSTLQNVDIVHLIGNTTAPTFTLGTGAGTGATGTLSANSSDVAGLISITTGTASTTANSTQITLTFSSAYGAAPNVLLQPANANTAALNSTTQIFAGSTTGTFLITSNTAALATSTIYKWYYSIIQ